MASLPNRNAAGRAQVAREALQRMGGADVHDLIGSSAENFFFTPLAWDEVLLLHGPMAEATIHFHTMKNGMVGDVGRIGRPVLLLLPFMSRLGLLVEGLPSISEESANWLR